MPAPTRGWARLVFPDIDEEAAYESLWQQLEHVLRLDEPDPATAWEARMATLKTTEAKLIERRFDPIRLQGPGIDLTVGLLPTSCFWTAEFTTVDGVRHIANLPSEEVFTTPDPQRADGHVTSTKPLARRDGTIIRELRVRFEGGRRRDRRGREHGGAAQPRLVGRWRWPASARPSDREGRVSPLGTVFYDTLLAENAASHIALGSGFAFAVGEDDGGRINTSSTHVDFMIGSDDIDVTGITADGSTCPSCTPAAGSLTCVRGVEKSLHMDSQASESTRRPIPCRLIRSVW